MRQRVRQVPGAVSVARRSDGVPAARWTMSRAAIIAVLLAGAAASPLHAQGDGFLFGRPAGSVTLRGGFSQARAGSDLFQEVQQDLTLSKRDFGGLSGGAEVAVRVAERLDLTGDIGYMRTSAPSHYRAFVDNNNQEISQVTTLRRIPMTANAKLYLTPPGRSVGRFAWIPNTIAPWVEAGVGVMQYEFRQEGDFVDFTTNNVRPDLFQSDGWTPMAQAVVGADYTLTPRFAITGDARYLWVRGPRLSSDFIGYQPLDLSGVALSLGLTVRL